MLTINGTTATPPTNATPTVANAIPDQTATAGTAFTYQFPTNTFNDTDTSDTLSYMATKPDDTALPTWLTFTAGTRTFTGTPGASDVETVSVEVTATDTSSATVSDEFDIVVSADPNAGICPRTASVRDALLAKITGVTDCALVTDTHLAAITGSLLLDAKSITALAAGDFDGLTALTTIDLSDNSLTALPAGVFDELTALLALGLNDNSLTGLPADVFDKLTALQQLFLNVNSLTGFPAGVFDELTALTELYLNGNSLTALPADVFDELTALTLLYLHGNSLTALPADAFDELTALLALGLNDNSLTALPAGVFDGLTALTELDLDTNSLTALPDDVFDDLTSLTSLDLSGNPGAPFSPTAVALPDDGTVPAAGGTVMLDGSGSGGAWGTNVTYGWALTTPASGVTVTFDDAASAEPTVTIPQVTVGTDLVFTLTVTGRADNSSTSISTGTDTATVTPTAPANAVPTVPNPIPDQTATAGTAFMYAFPTNTFNDTDTGDTLSYMATKADDTTLPTWLTFTAGTRTFTGTPATTDVETLAVKVTADDSNGGTVSDEFDIMVAADTTPPTLTIATVAANGVGITLGFSEAVARTQAARPQASAFTVTADGIAVTVDDINTISGQVDALVVTVSPVSIRQGQTVVVTYTDPTTGDDARAIQDLAGNDAASFTTGMNSVAAVTNSSTLAAVAPGAPRSLTATASGTDTINLSWTAPVDNGGSVITGYKIEISSDSGTTWTDQVADTASTATTYEHTGLAASTTRHYRVSAINSIGTGTTASNVANTTTDAATATAPGAPTGLTATASGTSTINLSWTAPASNGGSAITGYKIEISPNGTSSWTDLQANTAGTNTTHEHRNLAASTTRHYRVSAINGIGTSISSDVANATTGAATAPGAPRSLTATASGTTTINLSWTAPASTGGSAITGYKIEVSPNGTSSWTDQVADTASTTTTYEHTGLAASTTRHYRVSAINSIGASLPSSVADATTGAPGNNAPTVTTAIPDQTATVGAAFSYAFPDTTFSDVDTGQTLSYMATQVDGTPLPTWLVFTAGTRTFAGTPAASDAGTVPVQVTASDGNGGSVSDDFGITVSAAGTPPAPTNSAPTVTSAIPDQSATAGTAFSYAFPDTTFSDADTGDTLSYTATQADGTALPTWLGFTAGTRTFAGTPQAGDAGTVPVRVTASDGKGGSVNDDFDITVTSSGNSAPMVANPIPDLSAPVDAAFTFTFPARTFRDVDTGDRLTYSATQADGTPLPAWLGFNGGTRTFAGTPQAGDAGTVSVKLTATDGEGESVSVTFDITVGAVGDLVVNFGTHTDATVRVRESGTPHRLMLLLSREAPHPLTIPLVVTHVGGATAADYTGLPASVTFATGKRAAGFDIRAIPDQARELGEGLRLDFGALPSGVRQGTWGLYETIEFRDERSERTVRFGAEAYAAVEGGAAAAVSIHLDAPVAFEPLEVGLRLEYGGGATAADHGSIPTVVPFGVGERTQTIMVSATDDAVDDDGESVSLSFVQDPGRVITGKGSVTTTVALGDDDGLGAVTVSFGAPTYTATEGGAAATVRVELNAAPGRAVTAPLTTVHNGGATASDYSGVPANVAFGANQTAQTFTVTATSDAGADGGESLSIGFGTLPAGVFAGRPAAAVVALSDGTEQEFLVNFGTAADSYDIEVPEGDQPHRFSVYLGTDRLQAIWNGRPQRPVTIPLVVTHTGGATEADYAPIPASVTFAAGEGRAGFDVRALFDQEVETGEGLRIDFGPLPPGVTKDTWGPYETIAFVDVDERSSAPGAPRVEAVAGSATSLRATWTPVSNPGGPVVSGYDVQYRKAGGTGADWTDGPRNAPFSEVEIGSLEEGVSYEVQVRAASSEGMGPYSLPGTGTTHALAVRVAEAPSQLQHHDAAAFRVVFEFSEAVVVAAEATSLAESFFAETGEVTSARRLSQRRLEVTFAPGTTYEEIVGVEAASACGSAGAICTAEAVPLSHGIELAVPGPGTPVVTIRARSATVEEGDPVVFEVQRLDPSSGTDPLLVALERLVEGVVFVDPPPVAVAFTAGVERVSVSLATVNGGGAEDGGRVRYRVAVPPRSRGYVVGNPGAAEVVVRDEVSSPTPADPDADPTPPTPDGTCVAGAHTLCLQDSRFSVTVDWSTADGAGQGLVAPERTHDSGMFHFFDANSWEVLIKVLDGCALNGHVWVYGASTTDVGYVIQVTDTATGAAREYRNEPGMPAAAITDSEAFPASCRLQ